MQLRQYSAKVTSICWIDTFGELTPCYRKIWKIWCDPWVTSQIRNRRPGATSKLSQLEYESVWVWTLRSFFICTSHYALGRSIKITFPDDMVAPADISEQEVRSFLTPTVPRSIALGWRSEEGWAKSDFIVMCPPKWSLVKPINEWMSQSGGNAEVFVLFDDNDDCRTARQLDGQRCWWWFLCDFWYRVMVSPVSRL